MLFAVFQEEESKKYLSDHLFFAPDYSLSRLISISARASPYTIEYLRHLKDFFGIVFKLKADAETQSVLVSCLGVGFKNLSKASF